MDDDGNYEVGPLAETESYQLRVVADGYNFVDDGSGDFKSMKYSSVDVTIADEQGKAIDGVLVSLSAPSMRSSALTDGDGHVAFTNLLPDTYYLQPLLKEYEFTPAHQMVRVAEGNVVEQTFVAVRHAYSVFGRLAKLNGEPFSGVAVHATTGDVGQLSTLSTDNGDRVMVMVVMCYTILIGRVRGDLE